MLYVTWTRLDVHPLSHERRIHGGGGGGDSWETRFHWNLYFNGKFKETWNHSFKQVDLAAQHMDALVTLVSGDVVVWYQIGCHCMAPTSLALASRNDTFLASSWLHLYGGQTRLKRRGIPVFQAHPSGPRDEKRENNVFHSAVENWIFISYCKKIKSFVHEITFLKSSLVTFLSSS